MNFIKRGLLGITRKLGKSFILLAVIFILGNIMAGAISIQQATSNVEREIKEKLGAAATLDLDWEAVDKLTDEERMNLELERIGIDLITTVGELSYVKYFDYNMTTWLASEHFESYGSEEMGSDYGDFELMMQNFQLKGTNYAPLIDFEEQRATLSEGRIFTQDEVDRGTSVAIISQKLAELNNLHVGDQFILTNAIHNYDSETFEVGELYSSRDIVLEIIGLFESYEAKEDAGQSDNGMTDWMDIDYQNTVYVPNEIVASELRYQLEQRMEMDEDFARMVEEEDISFEHYMPMFVLNSPDDSEAFVEEVTPMLPALYKVVSATDQYDSIAGPVESMSNLSKSILIATIIVTVFIIGLVVLLFLRDRKHELGIYLSLGERRGRVVGQIVIEVMVVAAIGITISLFTGNILAGQISESMMETYDSEFYEDYMYLYDFQTDLTTADVVNSYKISLDSTYVFGFYGIGLLTILLSTAVPLMYIVRLNPKKILM